MKIIELPEELCIYAKELSKNIHEYEILNKESFKYLNFYRKEFQKLLKKKYPNLDTDKEVSYDPQTNQIFFYEK
jgi:hypothetical protein